MEPETHSPVAESTTNAESMESFIARWGEALAVKVLDTIEPLHNPEDPEAAHLFAEAIAKINKHRRLSGIVDGDILPAQEHIIRATAKAFYILKKRNSFLIGEMGTGKTLMASSIAFASQMPMRVLVQAPPHIVPKWCAELKMSLPDVGIFNINGRDALSHLQVLQDQAASGPARRHEFYVISRERAKNSYYWKAAFQRRQVDDSKRNQGFLHCPQCGNRLKEKKEDGNDSRLPLSENQLERKKHFCQATVGYRIYRHAGKDQEEKVLKYRRVPPFYKLNSNETREPIECGCPLWVATPRVRRYSPAEFIKRQMKGVFDLFICDEVHEQKAGNTIQGNAFGSLSASCKRTLALTGTLNGGYADELFHLLWRMGAARLKDEGFSHNNEQDWMDVYGVLQVIRYLDEEDTRSGKGKRADKIVRRAPGVSPVAVARHLLDKCCFIRLPEISQLLPAFDEEVLSTAMNEEQEHAYKRLEQQLSEATDPFSETGAQLMSKTLQVLLAYPDSCVLYPETITVKSEEGEVTVVAEAPQLSPEQTLPKEQEMLRIVTAEKAAGRRTIVFAVNTHKRDILGRIEQKLIEAGVRTAVLRASVAPEKRMGWIQKKVEEGIDTIVTSPELVKTGLDLLDFPTFVYMQTGYSIFTLRQSSRRSWRLGQKRPVKVYYLCYHRTMQEEALRLIATKLHTSLMVEGELTEGGLTDLSSSASNSILQDLAKSLREGMKGGAAEAWHKLRQTEKLQDNSENAAREETSSSCQPTTNESVAEHPALERQQETTVVRVRITKVAAGKGRGRTRIEEKEVDSSNLASILEKETQDASAVQFLMF